MAGRQPQRPPALMATKGICKIKNGWVHQDSVWVRYDDGKRLEIPASQYAEQGFQPPIAQLPECKGVRQDALGAFSAITLRCHRTECRAYSAATDIPVILAR